MSRPMMNLGAARDPEQLAKMEELRRRGLCAFCPDQLVPYHNSLLWYETSCWVVTPNDYPYEHTALHLLFIPRRHIRGFDELELQELTQFHGLVARVVADNQLASYALVMRSGDPHYNGGTLDHFHAHLITGDHESPDFESVKFKVASRPKLS